MQKKTDFLQTVTRHRLLRLLLFVAALGLLACGAVADGQQGGAIIGRWQYKRAQQEIVIEFRPDGTFHQTTKTDAGQQELRGRYVLHEGSLQVLPNGHMLPEQITCRFQDADTLDLTFLSGETIHARRLQIPQDTPERPSQTTPSLPADPETPPSPSGALPESASGGARKPERLLLTRAWEPNQKAFSILVPNGWKLAGGVFSVNALQMNGLGNTISPKCDFAVKSDDRGTIMIRWLPSWNYADLTYSRMGSGLFRPGQVYQGMLVTPIMNARQFLTETLRRERPQASDFRVIAEDLMNEVTVAFAGQAELINRNLRQLNVAPMRFDSLAMLVEYSEGGERYREGMLTAIVDNRGSAYQWSNEDTLMFRAPAAAFESWKPILDMIQSSREVNPQWMASVGKAMGQRAKSALETEQYVDRVRGEIFENRRRANATIRYEPSLFLTGQVGYRNPFNGDMERGTPAYRCRWVSSGRNPVHRRRRLRPEPFRGIHGAGLEAFRAS